MSIPEEKNDEAPSIGPRMIKFKKKQEETPKESEKMIATNDKNVAPASVDEKIVVEEDDEKPAFVPRRFNMRQKERKSEDAGYIASTVVEKKEPEKIAEEKPKGLQLNLDEPVTRPAEEEVEKPKFNLKLKNRPK